MEGPIDDLHFDVDDLVTGVDTAFYRFFNAVDYRRNVFPGNGAADDLVFNLDPFATLIRLNLDQGMTVLAAPARLADELPFAIGVFGDGFAISDLRRAGTGVDFELTQEAVANDLQVQLTHSRNNE